MSPTAADSGSGGGDVMTDGDHPSNNQIGPAGAQFSGQHAQGTKNQIWTAVDH